MLLANFHSLIFVIFALACTNEASKILLVFPVQSPSHGILGMGYVDNLLKAGHEVTYITPYSRKEPTSPPKFHQIYIDYPEEFSLHRYVKTDKILNKEIDLEDYSWVFTLFFDAYKYFLEHGDIQKLLSDRNATFDLVIVDWLFTELGAGFAAVFQCPLIWASSIDPHWMILELVDEAPNPAYVPDPLSNNIPPFTFRQRMEELWMRVQTVVAMKFVESSYVPIYEKIFVPAADRRGITMPPYSQIKYNASFVMSNSHISLGEPVRLPQNFIQIGGYHIDPTPTPLPEDLKKIMDNAKDGVIYFSMGSNLKSKDMPEQMKRQFLEMFSLFKQTVLWKFEETLKDLPNNVHILKWAPQQSILAHPNCVVFITHGGWLSSTEAVHFGVPIIGVPVYGDQFINVNRAVVRGFAKKVDFSYNTPRDMKVAIEEILCDPSYREKVKYLSLVYHDRPVHPAQEMVHWVEHTIKTRGAPHLRSRALMTPWYQKMYLDLATIVAIAVYGLYFSVKKLLFRFSKKTLTTVKKVQ